MSLLDIDKDYDNTVFENWFSHTFTCEYWGEWGEIELGRGYKENKYLPKGKYYLYYDSDINVEILKYAGIRKKNCLRILGTIL